MRAWSPSTIPGVSGDPLPSQPLPPGQSVLPSGIATGEAFGVASMQRLLQGVTRTAFPAQAGVALPFGFTSAHYVRNDLTSPRVAFINAFVALAGSLETGTGDILTINACTLQYNGVRHQCLFGGSSSGVAANLSEIESDPLNGLFLPAGSLILVRGLLTPGPAGGIPFISGGPYFNAALGDAVQQTASDFTMSGDYSGNALSTGAMRPCAIRGMLSGEVVGVIGDSRNTGQNDTTIDSTGNHGDISRAFGSTFNILSVARGGDKAQVYATSSTLRTTLLTGGVTRIVNGLGINDLRGGRTAVQLQADQTTIKNKTPNIPHYLCTVYPDSTGAWNLADGSDQTVSGHLAELIAYNTWIRSGGAVAAGFAGYFEVADFNEMAPRNSGKWKADGTTSKYTSDGLHGSTFATTGITLTPLW